MLICVYVFFVIFCVLFVFVFIIGAFHFLGRKNFDGKTNVRWNRLIVMVLPFSILMTPDVCFLLSTTNPLLLSTCT